MPNLALPFSNRTYRLVTRSDFDGLVCAALLKELGLLQEILFVHPKDVQDGKVELTADDITTNLPYRPEVALSFDHHSSEELRVREDHGNRVMAAEADSAARVVYEHFGGGATFPSVSVEMMDAVDRADVAQLSMDDILNPRDWILLSFLMRRGGHPPHQPLPRDALNPRCTVSIHVLWGLKQQNTVFAVGRSILNRSSQVDIGALMLAHGGGGHEAAGTCQVDNDRAETVLADLIQTIIDGEREPVAG